MKIDITWQVTAKIMAIFILGVVIGTVWMPFIGTSEKECNCLTTVDLNRTDLSAVIVLSRFCEGMGLQSSVIWRQIDGNVYAEPICVTGR